MVSGWRYSLSMKKSLADFKFCRFTLVPDGSFSRLF